MHIFRERRVGEEQKCVYPEEDFISIRRCRNPLDVESVKSVKIRKRETFPVAGRTRTHRLDLELLFWAALMWSRRCPSSAQHKPLSYRICASKHVSRHPQAHYTFSRSHRNAHICFKTVFFCGQLLGEDRCLAHFLSSIHEEERTNADVNTGNDTNKIENKPNYLHEMNL